LGATLGPEEASLHRKTWARVEKKDSERRRDARSAFCKKSPSEAKIEGKGGEYLAFCLGKHDVRIEESSA